MTVNCLSLVKIAIIDGALIEAPECDSEEFTCQVGEEVGDEFDDDHEGEDVILSCIRHTPQLTYPSSGVPFHNRKK